MRSDDTERLAELQRSGALAEVYAEVSADLFAEWLAAPDLRTREAIWSEYKIFDLFKKRLTKAVNRGAKK